MTTDLTASTEHSLQLEQRIAQGIDGLSEEQRSQLSKALFPDTHVESIELLGSQRDFKPLAIKYSREINARLEKFAKVLQQSVQNPEKSYEFSDLELSNDLLAVAKIIAKRYGWDDVSQALEEEELTTDEIQTIVVTQVNLQQKNDFLLKPLRVLVALLQQQEIVVLTLFQSTNSGQDS